MLELGLKPADADPCLFTKGEGKDAVRIELYVDDALIFGGFDRVCKLVEAIAAKFEIKDVGVLTPLAAFKFLGMELLRTSEPTLGIILKQERYARQLLDRFGMKDCKPVSCPMVTGVKLDHEGDDLPEDNEYAAIVGSLLYLSVKTRPDISFAVGVLSRFMSCPKVPHMQAAKRVLRYIAKDPGAGIIFRGKALSDNQSPMLSCRLYSDSDYAADPIMRKSTSGMVFTVNGAPIMWKSKLQTIVALSTCEAEFVAAAAAVREGLWLQKVIHAVIGKSQSLDLFCDNESALSLLSSATSKVTGRTKHIDVQFWFVLDHIMKGSMVPRFIRSEDMLADGFTKPYSGPANDANVGRLGMYAKGVKN
jgi:hypothetical protein